MKAEDITKGSTLLATLNEENFPFGMHNDLIADLHRMVNIALNTPVDEEILSNRDNIEWALVPKCDSNVDKELDSNRTLIYCEKCGCNSFRLNEEICFKIVDLTIDASLRNLECFACGHPLHSIKTPTETIKINLKNP